MSDNEPLTDENRIQRIKFLVEQSKLYSEFLTGSLEPVNDPPASDKLKDQESEHVDNSPPPSQPPPPKRTRRTKNKSQKPTKTPDQPAITTFFQPPPKKSSTQPSSIEVPLHPHQMTAVKWLTMLYQNGLNGILADEMGLGKTLEVIAFLAYLMENGVEGPFLVLAPLSTLGNWCNEIKKFAPSIEYVKYYGTPSERTKLRRSKSKWKSIVISTYEVAMADAQYLRNTNWKYIIVDEGHRLKNIDSKLMKSLKTFSSANRMLLTGTPLQNNLAELWSLLNFLLPDIFVDLDIFHSWFESGEANIDTNDEKTLVTSLHDILRPFLLRRLKKDVGLYMPPKREYVLFLGLSQLQQDLYQQLLAGTARQFVTEQMVMEYKQQGQIRKTNQEVPEPVLKQIKQELKAKTYSNLMMQLRLSCNSPYLFWYPWLVDDSMDIDSRIEETSGKLIMLNRLMQKLKKSGHKVLIFSQFTKMLDLLEDWAVYREYNYVRIDGGVSQERRQEIMDDFATKDNDIDLFLLTTRSGGQGVNLVSADTVIIFDSDWNPQQDLQAMDRVHRIGQTKPILVIRLCTGDTVEQDLLKRAVQKLELNQIVIESGQFQGPIPDNKTNEEKIDIMKQQLQAHKLKFDQTTDSQITDSDLDKVLDRSLDAYELAQTSPELTENIVCVTSTI